MGNRRNIIGGRDGWMRIRIEPSGEIVTVPEHLQVDLERSTGDRDFFTVIEGTHQGKRCSLTRGNLTPSAIALRKPAQLFLDLSKGALRCESLQIGAQVDPSNPLPVGQHPVQLPDFPHNKGIKYLDESRYAKSWFYIGSGSAVTGETGRDRYLHPGMISAGCVTIDALDWTALYELIIRCRGSDGKTVGTITVRK